MMRFVFVYMKYSHYLFFFFLNTPQQHNKREEVGVEDSVVIIVHDILVNNKYYKFYLCDMSEQIIYHLFIYLLHNWYNIS